MYSNNTQDFLDSEGVSKGDTLKITTESGITRKGILMPRSQQGDRNCIVLKLESGYNIGIDTDKVVELELVERKDEGGEEKPSKPGKVKGKDNVLVLHTGGTIASRVSYEEGGVKPAFDVEDLLQMYPELFEKANIDSKVVSQMLSEDMEPEHWQMIARTVFENIENYDGVIIGHGTDTMQYTASALSFMLRNLGKPVVFVGAQRSSDRPSSDAAVNLESALNFISRGIPGVFVSMHAGSSDTKVSIHRGTRVRKMHTSRRDAFKSVSSKPFAEVDYRTGELTVNGDFSEPEEELELMDDLEKDVGFLKVVPGMSPEEVRFHGGRKGLVVEGTGLGHMPVNSFDEHTKHHEEILEEIREIADSSLVCMTSQCINGRVNMKVYDAGVKIRNAGVVSAESMIPGTAYVKLMWVLGNSETVEEATELFSEDVAGEIILREDIDGFC